MGSRVRAYPTATPQVATKQEEFSSEWPGSCGGQNCTEIPLVAGSRNESVPW